MYSTSGYTLATVCVPSRKKFKKVVYGLMETGMIEKVAPPFFPSYEDGDSKWFQGVSIKKESAFADEYVTRKSEGCNTRTCTFETRYIGECLYKITNKGRELLFKMQCVSQLDESVMSKYLQDIS